MLIIVASRINLMPDRASIVREARKRALVDLECAAFTRNGVQFFYRHIEARTLLIGTCADRHGSWYEPFKP